MSTPTPAPPSRRSSALIHAAPLLAAAAAGAIVYYRALAVFFSQDDFLGLARASGLAPRLAQPWRYIANQAIWDLLRPVAGLDPWPYHLLSLLSHLACVALLYVLLARRLSRPAALAGAAYFAVHPALFSTLYWFSTVGDPLALCFGLSVLLLVDRRGPARWLAVPLYALSLLAKESLILLPAVVWAIRVWAPERRITATGTTSTDRSAPRAIDATVIALAAVAVLYVAYFALLAYGSYFVAPTSDARGIAAAAQAPYALSWGHNLWQNALTFLGWTVNFLLPTVRGFTDVVDPTVYPWAIGALILWLAGLASRRLRAAGWWAGGTVWLLFLLPVLPLRNHTYHYYLYAPLAGAAWCVAAAVEVALSPRRGRVPAQRPRARPGAPVPATPIPGGGLSWSLAGGLAALLTLNGALLVRKIETMPFVLAELRAESLIDRARIAGNVQQGLAAAALPPGVTLRFWSPTAASLGPRGEPLAEPAPRETYWERNVRDALLDGLAVRVMFPEVAAVRFVREFEPTGDSTRYAVYRPEGRLGVVGSAELDSIIRSRPPGR